MVAPKRSRKMPETVIRTSMRGRARRSRGMTSTSATRFIASRRGRTPMSHSACATPSPCVLMLSMPQSTMPMDSGYLPRSASSRLNSAATMASDF